MSVLKKLKEIQKKGDEAGGEIWYAEVVSFELDKLIADLESKESDGGKFKFNSVDQERVINELAKENYKLKQKLNSMVT